jgi:cytidine deaminase
MFMAHAAALRSGALTRQVGAAITTHDGQLLALGTNDVAKPGGGAYWCEDHPDGRAIATPELEHTPTDRVRSAVLDDALRKLVASGWRPPAAVGYPSNADWVADAEAQLATWLRSAGSSGEQRSLLIDEWIDVHREVHAEMLALTDAARRGVATSGAALFTTTFPCRDCAKHLLASGISEAIFLEPYPRSRVRYLFGDDVALEPSKQRPTSLCLRQFVGVAPRIYQDLFRMPDRRSRLQWRAERATYRWNEFSNMGLASLKMESCDVSASLMKEKTALATLSDALSEATGAPDSTGPKGRRTERVADGVQRTPPGVRGAELHRRLASE